MTLEGRNSVTVIFCVINITVNAITTFNIMGFN